MERATRCHIDNSNGHPDPDNEWSQGYGYQFWRCTEGRYRGDGAHGQVCMVDEKNDAVLAVTCETADGMGLEFSMIRHFLFLAFDAAPGTREEQETFRLRAEGLGYPVPADDGSAVPLPQGIFMPLQETRYFSSISLRMAEDDVISISLGGGNELPPLGRGEWRRTEEKDPFGLPLTMLGAYGWEKGRLHAAVRCPQDPMTVDVRIRWEGDRMFMEGFGIAAPEGCLELIRKTE